MVDESAISGCEAVTLIASKNANSANCATIGLPVGEHYITAIYPGDLTNRFSSADTTQTVDAPGNTPPVPLYLFNTGTYNFYTDSEAEKDYVLTTYPDWALKGIAANVFPLQIIHTAPVYRFNAGSYHFYTIDATERD